jgi:hypothetical protein
LTFPGNPVFCFGRERLLASKIVVRAERLLGKLKLPPEEFALAAWEAAVGKRIAARTRAVSVVRGKLLVEVEDIVWQRQLATLERQILAKLEGLLGSRVIEALDLRPMPKDAAVPRKQPERAVAARVAAASEDDADGITDPGLALIYRRARNKATA